MEMEKQDHIQQQHWLAIGYEREYPRPACRTAPTEKQEKLPVYSLLVGAAWYYIGERMATKRVYRVYIAEIWSGCASLIIMAANRKQRSANCNCQYDIGWYDATKHSEKRELLLFILKRMCSILSTCFCWWYFGRKQKERERESLSSWILSNPLKWIWLCNRSFFSCQNLWIERKKRNPLHLFFSYSQKRRHTILESCYIGKQQQQQPKKDFCALLLISSGSTEL